MAMMLRHKPTGDVYIYTTLLANREDMEVFESTPPPPSPQPAKLEATVIPTAAKLKSAGDKT